uniref:mTERF family protein n=1 Tax=Zea mays TaxID=4577 RepID=B6SJK3_MAIZE|nr:mTERF family protein [Zea mays]
MLANVCRRRLTIPLSPILAAAAAAASGKNPIHSNHARALLSQSYYSSAFQAAPDREPCPTTVSYLVSCGVSPAVAAARKVRIRDTDRADAVRALLRKYGFSEADITRTVRLDPLLLTFDPDRTIRPKLDFFVSLGIQPRLLATEPHILARSLEKHIIPCIEFFRTILRTDDNIRIAVSRVPRALMTDIESTMRPAVEAFLSHGLSMEAIAKLLMIHMGMIKTPPERIREAFHDLKALGLRVTDTGFLYGFRVICSLRRETMVRKVAVFKSFGVSESDLFRAFKTQPTILLVGDETIKKKFRFFLDVMKLEIADVMAQPLTLALSLEKNIMPRCAVLSILMKEGKLKRTQKLIPPLLSNSRVFSERYVLRHAKDVPDVVKAFEGKIKFQGFGESEVRTSVPLND